jgi:hypothetical protein
MECLFVIGRTPMLFIHFDLSFLVFLFQRIPPSVVRIFHAIVSCMERICRNRLFLPPSLVVHVHAVSKPRVAYEYLKKGGAQ